MATLALLNAYSYVDGHDFTGDTNQATLQMEAAQLDKSTFRSAGWAELGAGLKSSTFDLAGFWQAGDGMVDPVAFGALGVRNRVHTFGPVEAEGGVAYMWQAGQFTYSLLGQIGEMAPFSLQAQGSDSVGVVRGQLAAKLATVAATGPAGSAVQLGAGSAGQYLYATVHVFTAGTTITLGLESDDAEAFTTPTTVETIGPITTTGGTWMTRVDASSITDGWFRFNISAITGEFELAGAIALQ